MMVPLGVWADRRGLREPFLFCMAVQLVGNLLYGAAGHWTSPTLALVGRLLAGFGCASTALAGTYISRTVPIGSQTKMFSVQVAPAAASR